MKRLLLATTAITAVGGAAQAAEVTLSGYAEIGIFGGDDSVDPQFHNDFQVNLNFAGETDGGLSFGGYVELEDDEDNAIGNDGARVNGGWQIDEEYFFVSGAFGTVTLGETEGAFNWALGYIYTGTSLQDDHSTHAGAYWNTGLDGQNDDQVARYDYSFGDFGVGGSLELDDSDSSGGTIWSVGGKWASSVNGMDVGLGVGYQENDDFELWGVAGTLALPNGLALAAGYADLDGAISHYASSNGFSANADSWYGANLSYTTGPLLVAANYGHYDMASINGTANSQDIEGFGLLVNYDLGGGAVVMAGYGHSNIPGATAVNVPAGAAIEQGSFNSNGEDTWSLGLGLSF